MAIAFTFPGQGSQSVGMGKDLAAAFPAARAVFEEVDEALAEKLSTLIWEGPEEALTLTANAQPALMAVSLAAVRALEAGGFSLKDKVAYVAGHSLGEYSALVASGVLTLAQAAPLVRFRAQAMQQAVPVGTGAMAAVLGMEAAKVIAGCAEVTAGFGAGSTEVVEAVNFNDPMQTVIAGSKAAVDKACEVLKANGAKRALPLPVSAPFHSSLMRPAAEALREKLASVRLAAPQIPVLNNIDVAVETDPDRICDALVRQAAGPVRWVESVRALATFGRDAAPEARGVSAIVECGPGRVLAGMAKRIVPELAAAAVYDPATLAEARQLLNTP